MLTQALAIKFDLPERVVAPADRYTEQAVEPFKVVDATLQTPWRDQFHPPEPEECHEPPVPYRRSPIQVPASARTELLARRLGSAGSARLDLLALLGGFVCRLSLLVRFRVFFRLLELFVPVGNFLLAFLLFLTPFSLQFPRAVDVRVRSPRSCGANSARCPGRSRLGP